MRRTSAGTNPRKSCIIPRWRCRNLDRLAPRPVAPMPDLALAFARAFARASGVSGQLPAARASFIRACTARKPRPTPKRSSLPTVLSICPAFVSPLCPVSGLFVFVNCSLTNGLGKIGTLSRHSSNISPWFASSSPSSSSSSMLISRPGGIRLSNNPAERSSASPGKSRALSSPK